jgi:hypothetical protein
MVDKKKRGRPRLEITDSERVRRQKAANKKAQEKTRSNLLLAGAVGKRFEAAKGQQEKKLGFNLTHQQFLTILLTRWENDQG